MQAEEQHFIKNYQDRHGRMKWVKDVQEDIIGVINNLCDKDGEFVLKTHQNMPADKAQKDWYRMVFQEHRKKYILDAVLECVQSSSVRKIAQDCCREKDFQSFCEQLVITETVNLRDTSCYQTIMRQTYDCCECRMGSGMSLVMMPDVKIKPLLMVEWLELLRQGTMITYMKLPQSDRSLPYSNGFYKGFFVEKKLCSFLAIWQEACHCSERDGINAILNQMWQAIIKADNASTKIEILFATACFLQQGVGDVAYSCDQSARDFVSSLCAYSEASPDEWYQWGKVKLFDTAAVRNLLKTYVAPILQQALQKLRPLLYRMTGKPIIMETYGGYAFSNASFALMLLRNFVLQYEVSEDTLRYLKSYTQDLCSTKDRLNGLSCLLDTNRVNVQIYLWGRSYPACCGLVFFIPRPTCYGPIMQDEDIRQFIELFFLKITDAYNEAAYDASDSSSRPKRRGMHDVLRRQ